MKVFVGDTVSMQPLFFRPPWTSGWIGLKEGCRCSLVQGFLYVEIWGGRSSKNGLKKKWVAIGHTGVHLCRNGKVKVLEKVVIKMDVCGWVCLCGSMKDKVSEKVVLKERWCPDWSWCFCPMFCCTCVIRSHLLFRGVVMVTLSCCKLCGNWAHCPCTQTVYRWCFETDIVWVFERADMYREEKSWQERLKSKRIIIITRSLSAPSQLSPRRKVPDTKNDRYDKKIWTGKTEVQKNWCAQNSTDRKDEEGTW